MADRNDRIPPPDDSQSRKHDSTWGKVTVVWRNVVPVAAIALAMWAVLLNSNKVDKADYNASQAKAEAARQKDGRRVAINVLCGGLSAVIDAGRMVITPVREGDRLVGPKGHQHLVFGELSNFLKTHGGGTAEERTLLTERAADGYARNIAKGVQKQAGNVKDIVNKNGTLNCTALVKASRATPQPAKAKKPTSPRNP